MKILFAVVVMMVFGGVTGGVPGNSSNAGPSRPHIIFLLPDGTLFLIIHHLFIYTYGGIKCRYYTPKNLPLSALNRSTDLGYNNVPWNTNSVTIGKLPHLERLAKDALFLP